MAIGLLAERPPAAGYASVRRRPPLSAGSTLVAVRRDASPEPSSGLSCSGWRCRQDRLTCSVCDGVRAVESVVPQLEPLLPLVSKPIQYVGGELNAVVKDWDAVDGPLGADVPRRLRGRRCPTRACRSSTRCSTSSADALAERTYAVWPDLEALMREHGVPQFTVDAHRPVGASTCSACRFSTELGYTNMLTALDLAGIPLHARRPRRVAPDRHRRRARRVQPRADRRLHRRRRARRRRAGRARDHRHRPRLEGRGPPGRPRGAAAAAGAHRRRLRARASTTSTTSPTAASSGSRRTAPACRGGSPSTP